MVPMDLDSVADELYAVAPEEFMPLRTQRAAEAKASGDRALAKEIAKLRKPTRSAWLVNLLAREAAEELESLLDLGDALRAAQQSLSGPDLRRLSAERHRAVDALARQAAAIGAEHGHTATEATRQEVAQTLQAALADSDAAAVVRAGRAVQGISYGGFGTIDLGPVPTLGAPRATRVEPPARSRRRSSAAPPDPDAARLEQRQRDAEEVLATAQRALNQATAERDATAAEAERAGQTAATSADRVTTLRRELADAERVAEEEADRAQQARRVYEEADEVRNAAQEAVDRAAAELESLPSR
jgi:hypothetical protein